MGGLIALIVFGLVFFALGCYGFTHFIKQFMAGERASSWLSVQGTITSSEVRVQPGSADRDGVTNPDTYDATVVYRYEVNGVSYSSARVSYGGNSFYLEGSAKKIVSEYPPGSSIQVFYNPQNPQVSTLQRGYNPSLNDVTGFIICLLFMLFSAGMIALVVIHAFILRDLK